MTAANPLDLDQQRRARAAAQQASRPQLTNPAGEPELERIGLGWQWKPRKDLTMKITRLKEASGEFTGELTVLCPDAGTVNGVIEWGRFNLMSAQTRGSLAKRLNNRVEGDWDQYLDLFSRSVVNRERVGEKIQRTDPSARPQPLRYLYEPMLPIGMSTLLYGSGGTGKSTVAAAVAVSVETGAGVFPGWRKPVTCPVLILDWEADKWVWQDRVNAIAAGIGITPPVIRYRSCRRRIVDDAEAIADAVIEEGIGLVIVDAVNQAFGVSGHEHSDPAEVAIRAFSTIREIVRTASPDQLDATEVTWLLIDHSTGADLQEGGATPMKSYGSVAKQWLARQQFYLATEKEASETRQELVMTQTKANYAWKMRPLPMVIERVNGSIKFGFGANITAPELEAQLTLGQRIIQTLKEGGLPQDRIRVLLDMDKRRNDQMKVATTITRMLTRGDLTRLPDGRIGIAEKHDQPEFDNEKI